MTIIQNHLYILLTILLTVYGQLIVKWRVIEAGAMPSGWWEKAEYFFRLITNPWVLTVYVAVFVAGISWMAAMTKLELNYAYPFMSATFVLVMICSSIFFHESINAAKIIGMVLIIAGLVIGSQG